ncbi:DnaJ domain-containing protein [Noviherbaspirillum sp.]|uniref:DnaJ domain-containing protein n=1 Tax=Noviherbaspirillum sp. TaxID=1926288 RepID=UPI002D6412AF|nr:DnaJ domain-containing protein [Noviherbaspirillum sp.]HZW20422.1 DnaJ domain-containing protein [Noviherbaspirillum sp.]
MKTHYDKLGVTRQASHSEIEQSYRHSLNAHIADNLADNRNRPLRRKDQLRLQQMRQAYLVLSSPARRMDYDLKLDQLEHARLRRIERMGTLAGLILLLAGLALIARGYYKQVYDEKAAAPAVQQAAVAASAQREDARQ